MSFESFETLDVRIIPYAPFALSVQLNRPAARNAMNFKMVAEITDLFNQLRDRLDIRAVVLSGAEGMFCAGGDIKEMRERQVPASESAHNLDVMLRLVNEAPQVTVAQVEGAALGGGLGLVCVSDIAIASDTALLGLPEVRLGIAPAFISPYVIQRVGLTRARELMLTGRRFNGTVACEYGFIHEVVDSDKIEKAVEHQLELIESCSPNAIRHIKELMFVVHDRPTDETVEYRADLLNSLRQHNEAQEGMLAFKEKRQPYWTNQKAHDD